MGWLAEVGEFCVDAAEAGVGPMVGGVPLQAPFDFRAELLDEFFAAGDLRFGFADVTGESVDLVQG
ncbi:MAG: hypothetical protein ACRD0C_13130 [Acidimicrobiia bacterium]